MKDALNLKSIRQRSPRQSVRRDQFIPSSLPNIFSLRHSSNDRQDSLSSPENKFPYAPAVNTASIPTLEGQVAEIDLGVSSNFSRIHSEYVESVDSKGHGLTCQTITEDEDEVLLPSRDPADLLSDLFPELHRFSKPASDSVGNLDSRDGSRNIMYITSKSIEGQTHAEDNEAISPFLQMPWNTPRTSLTDLSLLSNDEMDLELEKFGYSTESKPQIESTEAAEGSGSPYHMPNFVSVADRRSCSSVAIGEACEETNSETQTACSSLLPSEQWQHLQDVYSRGFLEPNSWLKVYPEVGNARTDGLNFLPIKGFQHFASQTDVWKSYPHGKASTASLYIDQSGVMRDTFYCGEASNMISLGSFVGVEGDPSSFNIPNPVAGNAVTGAECIERSQGDILASPYPYTPPKQFPMQLTYVDLNPPPSDGYTSVGSDTNSTYTISRPSSCTISRSVSTQGNGYIGNHGSPLPSQVHVPHGSSPEWTPPETPVYTQFDCTYNRGSTHVTSLQDSSRMQRSVNQHPAFRNITPASNGYSSSQIIFAERESRNLSQVATRNSPSGPRQDNNELLVKLRDQGVSYKEIKKRLNCPEAESTLRGRHRTLTKEKSQRVRKPVWTDNDIRILINSVTSLILSSKITQAAEGRESGCKISARWKYISEEIIRCGGSYKFGPGTCKKKYKDLVEMGAAPAIQELEKHRGHQDSEVTLADDRCTRLRGRRKSARRLSKPKCSIKC